MECIMDTNYRQILNIEKKSDSKSEKRYYTLADLYFNKDRMSEKEFNSAHLALKHGAAFVLFNNTPDAEFNAIWYSIYDIQGAEGRQLTNIQLIEKI